MTTSRAETKYCWDLDCIYQSSEAWEIEFSKLEKKVGTIANFRGKLSDSAKSVLSAFNCYYETSREIEKLYTYAHLRSDEDTSNTENLGRQDKIINLYTRFSAESSFLTPELLEIEKETLDLFLTEPELVNYKRTIKDIVRYRPHTLGKKEEEILALGSEVFSSFQKIFSQLSNADLDFGEIEADGKKEILSHGSYSLFLKNTNRSVRKKAFTQYYAVFDQHKNMLAANYSSSVKKNCYLAKVKNYKSAREKSLFSDNVSANVYDNLITTVSNNLSSLHKYYELRKKALKLDKAEIFDTYVPLTNSVKIKHSYENAVDIIIKSLKPLGDDYCSILASGLTTERWVDVLENKGKRSGAYSSGCYDSYPYILMNYKEEDLNSVYTLTHEAGHSMHSYYSRKHQNYQDHNYTIFVAEVASTFNEQLLSKYLNELYADDQKTRFYLINHQIDDIKATLFRQCMFAEFEMIVHQRSEKNQNTTLDDYRSIYKDLLCKYFGPAVEIGELDSLECFRIPHFYSAFYVYKYATGLSAAIALSENVLEGNDRELDQYLNFLKSGGSKYPLELLKDAGVDMSSPEPIEKAVEVFQGLVDELEERC